MYGQTPLALLEVISETCQNCRKWKVKDFRRKGPEQIGKLRCLDLRDRSVGSAWHWWWHCALYPSTRQWALHLWCIPPRLAFSAESSLQDPQQVAAVPSCPDWCPMELCLQIGPAVRWNLSVSLQDHRNYAGRNSKIPFSTLNASNIHPQILCAQI